MNRFKFVLGSCLLGALTLNCYSGTFEDLAKKTLSNPENRETFGDSPEDYTFLFGVPAQEKGKLYLCFKAAYKNEDGVVDSEELQILEVDESGKKKAKLVFVDMVLAGFEDMTSVKIPKEDRIKIEDAYIQYSKEEFRLKGKSFVEYAKQMLKKKDLTAQDRKFFNKVIRN